MITDRELLIALAARLRVTADNCDIGTDDFNKGRASMARAVADEIVEHLAIESLATLKVVRPSA